MRPKRVLSRNRHHRGRDHAGDVGCEQQHSPQRLPAHRLLVEQQCRAERRADRHRHAQHGEQRGVAERAPERRVGQQVGEVAKAHEAQVPPVGQRIDAVVGDAQPQRERRRQHEHQQDDRQHRQREGRGGTLLPGHAIRPASSSRRRVTSSRSTRASISASPSRMVLSPRTTRSATSCTSSRNALPFGDVRREGRVLHLLGERAQDRRRQLWTRPGATSRRQVADHALEGQFAGRRGHVADQRPGLGRAADWRWRRSGWR